MRKRRASRSGSEISIQGPHAFQSTSLGRGSTVKAVPMRRFTRHFLYTYIWSIFTKKILHVRNFRFFCSPSKRKRHPLQMPLTFEEKNQSCAKIRSAVNSVFICSSPEQQVLRVSSSGRIYKYGVSPITNPVIGVPSLILRPVTTSP